MTEKRNYLYLYDLPKKDVTSVKLAEAFKAQGIDIGTKKPQINRDLFKPFYSAVIHIEEPKNYEDAKDKMKYFFLDQCQVRSLPFDKDLKGDNKNKIMNHNIFYKMPKEADKNALTYKWLHEKFGKYGTIKSTKISLNPDYTPRGYAFICFEDEASTKKCLAAEPSEEVFQFHAKDSRDVASKLSNNLYFKNVPKHFKEADIKKMFEPFGTIKSFVLNENEISKFGFVCYMSKDDPSDVSYGGKAVESAIAALNDKNLDETHKLYIRPFLNKEQREQEKFQETIRYKNSKKRCNLYVKNFPPNWTEQELGSLFKQYGEIEKVRLEKNPNTNNTYAFVCFKKPDACSMAKTSLHGSTHDGRTLQINHYEIKEIRDLQLEEMRDKRDWEKYIAQMGPGI